MINLPVTAGFVVTVLFSAVAVATPIGVRADFGPAGLSNEQVKQAIDVTSARQREINQYRNQGITDDFEKLHKRKYMQSPSVVIIRDKYNKKIIVDPKTNQIRVLGRGTNYSP